MLSILKRFLWPLTEMESEEELEKKKSSTDPEVFFTTLAAGLLALNAHLMTRNEREEREELSKLNYRSTLFDLFDDGDDW